MDAAERFERECKEINNILIEAGRPIVMYITGGGTEAISCLLNKGGASQYMLETVVNYAVESTHEIIGYKPKHYASVETAIALALKAYNRAAHLAGHDNVLGLGATSKLYHYGERVGRGHEIHVAIQTKNVTVVYTARPEFDVRSIEESINRDMILYALKAVTNNRIKGDVSLTVRHPLVQIEKQLATYPLLNKDGLRLISFNEEWDYIKEPVMYYPMVFPGSFNPVHHQHIKVAETVFQKTGKKVWFEISIINTDKPMVDAISLQERISQIGNAAKENEYIAGVLITDKPKFVDKVKQYKSPTFIVGTDTINRVYDPQYYDDAAEFLERKTINFLVFPRKGHTLRPELLNNPNIEVIPNTEYEDDGTSSTMIRNKK